MLRLPYSFKYIEGTYDIDGEIIPRRRYGSSNGDLCRKMDDCVGFCYFPFKEVNVRDYIASYHAPARFVFVLEIPDIDVRPFAGEVIKERYLPSFFEEMTGGIDTDKSRSSGNKDFFVFCVWAVGCFGHKGHMITILWLM